MELSLDRQSCRFFFDAVKNASYSMGRYDAVVITSPSLVFFFLQVYLIMRQLQQAGISPKAFILERYDLEPQKEIRVFDVRQGTDAKCEATPFGYSRRMKEELTKF